MISDLKCFEFAGQQGIRPKNLLLLLSKSRAMRAHMLLMVSVLASS
jgi:hypothetical protein